jgi:regulatory protein
VSIRSYRRKFRREPVFIVELDSGETLKLEAETMAVFPVQEGEQITEERLRAIHHHAALLEATASAARLLALRPRSALELSEKFLRDGHPADVIEEVIARLAASGQINDEEFAWKFARSRIKRRAMGPAALKAQLKKKGIDDRTIERMVAELLPEEDELNAALRLAEKKVKAYRKGDALKARNRLASFLNQRGFRPSVIRRVMERFGRPSASEET